MAPECSICFDEYSKDENFHKIINSEGYACEICYRFYNPENLETITKVFNVIKGRFGCSRTQVINIIDILKFIAEQLREDGQKQINGSELNNRIERLASSLGFHPIF